MNLQGTPQRLETVARIVYPTALGLVAYMSLWVASLFDEPPRFSLLALLAFAGFVVVLSEGIRLLSRWLDRHCTWQARPGFRLSLQLLGSTLLAVVYTLAIYLPVKLLEIRNGANDIIAWPHLAIACLLALIFALSLNALYVLLDFYAIWQRSRRDAERLRDAVLRAELDALRAHMNPHFLFNSLNTVHGLIAQNPQAARAMVVELSDVLRYALTHGSKDLVPLSQELEFLDAYRAVLEVRHGPGLQIRTSTMQDSDSVQLPPMSLQLLVENAVRHNRIAPDDPLVIDIERDDGRLSVSNPIKPRHGSTAGAGTGLSNIDQRYRLLGASGIVVREDADFFRVTLELLPCARS